MNNIDDSTLLLYVDGELPPEQRAQVEAAIAHSDELGARVDALRASCLPYRAAYERQSLPPVPERLARRIDELASVSSSPQWGQSRRRMPGMPWLAAAFVAGAVISGVLTGYLGSPSTAFQSGVSPWVRSVADYQVLYGRETVASIRDDPANTEKILADIRQRDGMPVRVPDLRQAGLKFKRVQRLDYNNRPLIQIVYLPERGDPIALCVLEDSHADEPVRAQQVGQMNTATWRSNRLAYVLLAKNTPVDLRQMAQQISDGKMPYLYSGV